ncbi:hypothetical protein E4U21_006595 [Claviceps maximensis]|nr:hypothetical protein E4U21_006595 [Claviceps maximensis]
MYPGWPQSAVDLVPLPLCDGPKLKPFDFQGPQKIEFIDYIGQGLHAHVFKVKILGQIYALKLFRFVYDDDWLGPAYDENETRESFSAFYDYSEPFSCECRAFGRLQEAGHDNLAIKCFGYLLLDEEHERAMMNQFSHLRELEFNGNPDYSGYHDLRSRFLGKDGRPPPIRGIVKEFGLVDEEVRILRTRDARRIFRDIVQLQQLGIIHIDVASRQIVNGKLCDFSTAITTPHYTTTPELNPLLTPEWISAMEFETFQFSINDYFDLDELVYTWNMEHEEDKISYYVFPGKHGDFPSKQCCRKTYNLRSTSTRDRVYTFVDPRLYEWKSFVASPGKKLSRAMDGKRKLCQKTKDSRGGIRKRRVRLDTYPPRWYLDCASKVAEEFKIWRSISTSLEWYFHDGLIFPRKKR